MSSKKEVEIEISANGDKVTIHFKGTKGSKCLDFTELLEKGIGAVEDRTYTQEYRQVPEKKVTNVSLNKYK